MTAFSPSSTNVPKTNQCSKTQVSSAFSTERELVRRAVAQRSWSNGNSSDRAGIAIEVETPNGIADIVFYQLRKDWRKHAVVGEIPSRWAYALHKIPYRRLFSKRDFAQLSGVSERRAAKALQEYSVLGLCRRSADGKNWIKTRQPLLAMTRLISVEAKLKDWRKALYQATRYQTYSDQSWVLLDKKTASAAVRNQSEFEARNVGLATISSTGHTEYHFIPASSGKLRQHDRWFVTSELLKHVDYER